MMGHAEGGVLTARTADVVEAELRGAHHWVKRHEKEEAAASARLAAAEAWSLAGAPPPPPPPPPRVRGWFELKGKRDGHDVSSSDFIVVVVVDVACERAHYTLPAAPCARTPFPACCSSFC
jgi:hypothetical protein